MRSRRFKHLLAVACLLTFAGSAAAKPAVPTQDATDKPRIVFFPARGESTAPGHRLIAKATNLVDHGGPKILSAKVSSSSGDLRSAMPRPPTTPTPKRSSASATSSARLPSTTPSRSIRASRRRTSGRERPTGSTPRRRRRTSPTRTSRPRSTGISRVIPSTRARSTRSSSRAPRTPRAAQAPHAAVRLSPIAPITAGSGAALRPRSTPSSRIRAAAAARSRAGRPGQNQEHLVTHETREAVTDPTGSGWYDGSPATRPTTSAPGCPSPSWVPAATAISTSGPMPQEPASQPRPGGAPATPWLTVNSEQCRGLNTAEWTASSGATSYELWGSSSSTFPSSSLYYSGTATLHIVNVGGTTYLHVRACNANGCSAFSNTGTATSIGGCK